MIIGGWVSKAHQEVTMIAESGTRPEALWIRRTDIVDGHLVLTIRGRWNIKAVEREDEEGTRTMYTYETAEIQHVVPDFFKTAEELRAYLRDNEAAILAEAQAVKAVPEAEAEVKSETLRLSLDEIREMIR